MKNFLSIILFLSIVNIAHSQYNIYTFAGTGISGNEGINGPASAATFNMPLAVASDKKGNVYIADWNNGMVKKVTPDGIVTAFIGTGVQGYSGEGGPAVNAQLHSPAAILVDDTGNVIIGDIGNNVVVKVDTFGIMTRLCGDPNYAGIYEGDGMLAVNAKINQPVGLAMDVQGNLYIAEAGNSRIRKIDTNGIISTFAGSANAGYSGDGGYAVDAEINAPWGLVIDNAGNLYFAESVNNIIRKVRPSGIISTYAGTGSAGYSGDGASPRDATLNGPAGLAFDSAGVLYVADWYNNIIRTISADGSVISTYAGNGVAGYSGDGGSPLNASFNGTAGIAINSNKVYIADWANNVVRYIGPPPSTVPLKLLSFTGNLQNKKTSLHWQTTNEYNISHFEVEVSSNGIVFIPIGFVNAGNLATTNNYTYQDDKSPAAITGNTIFYRLKMIDKDGKINYSSILRLGLPVKGLSLNIFPNPVKQTLNMELQSAVNDRYRFRIFDFAGKELLNKNYTLPSGTSLVSIPVSQLAKGTYTLQTHGANGGERLVRFIKQ